jgi:hypothetical protein
LVKVQSSATVYAVKDMQTLFTVSSFNSPKELGLPTSVRTISDSDFQKVYNSAQNASAILTKIKCSTNNYVGTNGSIFQVSSSMATNYAYDTAGFLDLGGICPNLKISAQALSQYIRTSDGTIYYVTGGQKRAFTSFATYQSAPYCNSTCTVNQVSNIFADSITSGANL